MERHCLHAVARGRSDDADRGYRTRLLLHSCDGRFRCVLLCASSPFRVPSPPSLPPSSPFYSPPSSLLGMPGDLAVEGRNAPGSPTGRNPLLPQELPHSQPANVARLANETPHPTPHPSRRRRRLHDWPAPRRRRLAGVQPPVCSLARSDGREVLRARPAEPGRSGQADVVVVGPSAAGLLRRKGQRLLTPPPPPPPPLFAPAPCPFSSSSPPLLPSN